MLKFKETKTGLDIEYSKGDTFEFNLETEEAVPAGSYFLFQVSPNGDVNDIIIEKKFEVLNNIFQISLPEKELLLLNIGESYLYRFIFHDIETKKTTTISGNLIVKWGA